MKILTFILGDMRTNCYFIIDETSQAAVVDPAASPDFIINKLAERGLDIKYIILTHAHFDHMLALEALREKTGAPLCVHSCDAEALSRPERTYMKQYADIDTPCRPAEIILNGGDILNLGASEIKVMHTPGHTPGSVCLICGDSIISGDTLFRDGIGRCDLYGGDYDMLKKSLAKLASLEGDYKVYPGHGPSTRLGRERENNIYLI